MSKLTAEEQLSLPPGQYETTKYCPDCHQLRGISAFRVDPYTNEVKAKYCKVHQARRNAEQAKAALKAFDDAYELAKQ